MKKKRLLLGVLAALVLTAGSCGKLTIEKETTRGKNAENEDGSVAVTRMTESVKNSGTSSPDSGEATETSRLSTTASTSRTTDSSMTTSTTASMATSATTSVAASTGTTTTSVRTTTTTSKNAAPNQTTGTTKSEAKAAAGQIDPEVKDLVLGEALRLGPSSITIQDIKLAKDDDGSDIVIFTYDWKNGSKETSSALFYLMFDVLQDGRSLEASFWADDVDLTATLESVPPGGEQKNVKVAFILKSKSDLLIELSELFVFTADPLQVKTKLPR